MAEILPPSRPNNSSSSREHDDGRGGKFLSIGQLHLYGNDLAELRKLSEVNPELADKVVEQRDREDARANVSYRFGLVTAMTLLVSILASFTLMVVFAGVIETVCLIVGILAVSLMVRVILTGEWSDTSWFGKFVNLLARALGASPTDSE